MFTADKRKMGVLVAPRWVTALAVLIAVTVITLNVKLLYDFFFGALGTSRPGPCAAMMPPDFRVTSMACAPTPCGRIALVLIGLSSASSRPAVPPLNKTPRRLISA